MSAIGSPYYPDFSSAYLKLKRAKAHIRDFDAQAMAWFAANPYSVWPELDPMTQTYGYVIGGRGRFPWEDLALIVGDAIHNLKSALDHLIAACCMAAGGDHTRAYFPVVRHRRALEGDIKRKVNGPGAGAIAISLVRNTKPYKRGNPSLYAMHCLDIADKYQLILAVKQTLDVSVVLEGGRQSVFHKTFRTASGKRRFVPVPASAKDYLVPAEISITGDIAFGGRLPRAGKPCIGELQTFAIVTEDIINLFAGTFYRSP